MKEEMASAGENEISIASEVLAGSIRPLIEQARARVAQSVNSELVHLYWRIGKRIREEISARRIAGQEKGVVDLLSGTLTREYGRGFSRRNLFNMIRVADTFDEERTVQTLSAQLSWSHFIEIIYLKDPLQRQFYAEMARVERPCARRCRGCSTSAPPSPENRRKWPGRSWRPCRRRTTPDLVFRDLYLLDFLGLADTYSERDLEAPILRELERFLLELGTDSPSSPSRSA